MAKINTHLKYESGIGFVLVGIVDKYALSAGLLMHTSHGTHRYVKSRSDAQLRGDVPSTSSLLGCQPVEYSDPLDETGVITPCGLIAWSFFNDTYTVSDAYYYSISPSLCALCVM